jgi:hypothetical protein
MDGGAGCERTGNRPLGVTGCAATAFGKPGATTTTHQYMVAIVGMPDPRQGERACAFVKRAAMSLARLWRDQGKRDQAGKLLAPV